MKTEILIQMDGLGKVHNTPFVPSSPSSTSTQQSGLVFLLAASNLPWQLDMAMLRRLEKRILVPLPGLKVCVVCM